MRTTIHAALRPEHIPRINFTALANAAADALARGWTGDQLARIAVQGVYTGAVRDLGALMHANLRTAADVDPPGATPTPAPIDRQQLDRERASAAHVDHAAWAARIRGKRPRRHAGAA